MPSRLVALTRSWKTYLPRLACARGVRTLARMEFEGTPASTEVQYTRCNPAQAPVFQRPRVGVLSVDFSAEREPNWLVQLVFDDAQIDVLRSQRRQQAPSAGATAQSNP